VEFDNPLLSDNDILKMWERMCSLTKHAKEADGVSYIAAPKLLLEDSFHQNTRKYGVVKKTSAQTGEQLETHKKTAREKLMAHKEQRALQASPAKSTISNTMAEQIVQQEGLQDVSEHREKEMAFSTMAAEEAAM
jgi:hypothetical protein